MGTAVIGLNLSEIVSATGVPKFRLGAVGGYDHPTYGYQEFVYGRANGAITGAGYVCVESTGFDMNMISTTNTAAGTYGHGSRVAVAMAALADNEYGWFQIYGKCVGRTLASAAKGTRLNTTATAGALDDDGTAGARPILGCTLGTATGGAEANNSDMILVYPSVGLTL